jgi:hypothetical protein
MSSDSAEDGEKFIIELENGSTGDIVRIGQKVSLKQSRGEGKYLYDQGFTFTSGSVGEGELFTVCDAVGSEAIAQNSAFSHCTVVTLKARSGNYIGCHTEDNSVVTEHELDIVDRCMMRVTLCTPATSFWYGPATIQSGINISIKGANNKYLYDQGDGHATFTSSEPDAGETFEISKDGGGIICFGDSVSLKSRDSKYLYDSTFTFTSESVGDGEKFTILNGGGVAYFNNGMPVTNESVVVFQNREGNFFGVHEDGSEKLDLMGVEKVARCASRIHIR